MAAFSTASLQRMERVRRRVVVTAVVIGLFGWLGFAVITFWAGIWAGAHPTPDPGLGDVVLIHVSSHTSHTVGYVTPTVAWVYERAALVFFVGIAVFLAIIFGAGAAKNRIEDAQDALDDAAGTRPPDMRNAR